MRVITGAGTSSLRNSAAPICNTPPTAVIYHETNAIGDTSAGGDDRSPGMKKERR